VALAQHGHRQRKVVFAGAHYAAVFGADVVGMSTVPEVVAAE
jgi:hypothetical protein